MFNKRGQVWIETMIYTLIAFSMIALVLAYAKPKIEEFQDKAIIDQSIGMLEEINELILTIVQGGPGNIRIPKLLIKKGALIIDGENDAIAFEMESIHMYSQLDKDVQIGGMIARTEKRGKYYKVKITMEYPALNITYADEDRIKEVGKASIKQPLTIKNNGEATLWTIETCSTAETCDSKLGWVIQSCSKETDISPSDTCKYKSKKITIDMEVN